MESAFNPDPPLGVASLLDVDETRRPVLEGALYEVPEVGLAAAELEAVLPAPCWGPTPISPPMALIDLEDPESLVYSYAVPVE